VVGVIGVFLFEFEPARPGVDDRLWVVVGDLPPAYLVCDHASTWQEALGAYVDEMRRWVKAVQEGSGLEDVIPVNAAPTTEHAGLLETRLDFVEENFINVPLDSLDGDT
jgi:hypothetical protein